MKRFPLFLSAVLCLGISVGAEDPYEEAPDDEKPSYTKLATDIETHFKDAWSEEDGQAVAMKQTLNRLQATEGFKDLHNYQILKSDDGKTIVNIELANGKSVFYEPGPPPKLVEFDPSNPDKLTPLKQSDDGKSVRRADKEKSDTAAFMKDYKGATKKMVVGGSTGRFFFDGQEQAYGSGAPQFGPGGKPVAGTYYDAPRSMTVANKLGSEVVPAKFEKSDTHYWVGKELYYRADKGDVKVGYMTAGTEGKVLFYHGGAHPPDTGTGNHTQQKKYWALYTVGDGKQTVKLGRYHEVIRTWPNEKIKGEGRNARLDISSHHRTVTNVPISKEKGEDNRAILRKIRGKYYRDTKVDQVELLDYGPPVKFGKENLRRFVDRSSGDLYAEHLVHGNVRLVRTGRQAVNYPIQTPVKRKPVKVELPKELMLPPAPEIEPEEKKKLSRAPSGLKVEAPKDVGAVLSRIFPKGPASGAPTKGYSWYQDARRALGTKGAKPVSKAEVDLLIETFRKSDNDVLRSKAAIALGSVARTSDHYEDIRQALVRTLVGDRRKPLVRNAISGIPSYQEAAAHSLLRMGEFQQLIDWSRGAAGSDTQVLLRDPTAIWSAYVLAGYTRDIAYSHDRSRQYLAYPVTDPKDDPSVLLRKHMPEYALILNNAFAGFTVQNDLKWRIQEKLTGLRGAERRFQFREQSTR